MKENTYFGKGCEYFCGQWEQDDNKEKCNPVLIFCSHKNNKDKYEGNCSKDLCPKKIKN